MPLYDFKIYHGRDYSVQKVFSGALARLHAKNFNTDPAAVRVQFTFLGSEVQDRYGGYGYSSGRGMLTVPKTSDYMVAHVNFDGPAEAWQAYCQQIVELYKKYGPGTKALQSIYLQKLDYEFESNLGLIQALSTEKGESSGNDEAPPGYFEQLKQ